MKIVVAGLSITSSWGNGHATTYRSLVKGLVNRGHHVLFLERDVPWYAKHRDLPCPPFGDTRLYHSKRDLRERFADDVRDADLVILGSYVPEAIEIGRWILQHARGITAFYDIDTPVTLEKVRNGDCEYLTPELIPQYDLYLSFSNGPLLRRLKKEFGARHAHALYCSVDPNHYFPEHRKSRYDLGYMGTYSTDRQPFLDALLVEPARQWQEGSFAVAGAQYPAKISWPANVRRLEHVAPPDHRHFYNDQRFTLNITRVDMIAAGYSPSVRLFEAAACAIPIISDYWAGLETIFTPGEEILISRSPSETLSFLRDQDDKHRIRIGEQARQRVLAQHTADHRAEELENYVRKLSG